MKSEMSKSDQIKDAFSAFIKQHTLEPNLLVLGVDVKKALVRENEYFLQKPSLYLNEGFEEFMGMRILTTPVCGEMFVAYKIPTPSQRD